MKLPLRHPSFAALVDLVEGRSTPQAQADLQAHVSTCAHCATEIGELERLLTLMRTDVSQDAPAALVERTINLFRPQPAERAAGPAPLRRILAALRFDTAAMQPAFGLRAGQSSARQVLFAAGARDLDLRLTPAGPAWTISGQVLGVCDAGEVELSGAGPTVQTSLNQLCEFTLPPVAPGTYTLIVRLADAELEVDGLVVGS